MRELTIAAVVDYMKEADRKLVKKDPKSLILRVMEGMGIEGKDRSTIDLHAFRDRGEEVEVICAAKKEVAEKILLQQRPANGAGIFIRELVRAGSDIVKAPVVWFTAGTTLGEAMSKAEQVAKGTPLAWSKSMGIGVRVKTGDLLRKARSIILKEENRPVEMAMEVQGTEAWIVSNLPTGFDRSEVLSVLAEWGWPVLAGRPMHSKSEMRVLADVAPKKLTIASGTKVPYVLRREFVVTTNPQQEQQATAAVPNQSADAKTEEKTQPMEQDDCQAEIDAQMQGFLNAEPAHSKNAGNLKTTAPASSSSSSPPLLKTVTPCMKPPAHTAAEGSYKAEMQELKKEMMQMMQAMEERQQRAEQRQDVAEQRVEGAIADIVAEHKATAASTTQDVGDLKSMLAMMMQQQNAMVQQQATMMQMLQGDERRVKPKVEAHSAQ